MLVDLHIHSCLSPCADDDMTPANICGMAHLKGLEAIAVTDHNTARNLPYVSEAARALGVIFLPGIEITTREEVHLLGYFPSVDSAVAAGEVFSAHLPPQPNRPRYFGNQRIVDCDDRVVGEETRMLIGATDLLLEDCARIVRSFGGVPVPAHINRGANGLLVNLGLMPAQPDFRLVEVSRSLPVDPAAVAGRTVLYSSDAHQLGAILEPEFAFPTERFSAGGLFTSLLNCAKCQ